VQRVRPARSGHLAAALLALLVATACKGAPAPPPPPPAAVALVNGQPISAPVVQRELDRLRRGASGESAATVDARDVPSLAKALLGPLIDRALLTQRAREAGLSVSDAEVQREIDRLAANAQEGGQSFEERLRKDGQTADALAEEIRERLLAEKYVAQKAGSPSAPAPAELRAFFDAHKSEYEQPEMVHAEQIVVSSAEEAKSLLDQVRAGASFEELARKHSESPDGKRGGDLGFFARGTMPKVFDDTCFGLRVGVPSGVVPSPYGFHLFKVVEKRSARRRPFEEARAEIQRRLLAERRAAAERSLLEGLRKGSQVQINEATLAGLR
jgi:peptidyl-prolyl cis-trans isomerase C